MGKEKILLILQYILWLLIGSIVISFISSSKVLSELVLAFIFGCYLGKKIANEL